MDSKWNLLFLQNLKINAGRTLQHIVRKAQGRIKLSRDRKGMYRSAM